MERWMQICAELIGMFGGPRSHLLTQQMYDPASKVFVLVVAGDEAEKYRDLVNSANELGRMASQRTTELVATAHKRN